MKKNDIEKRIEKLEEDSHPPVSWRSSIEGIIKRLDNLSQMYADIIHKLTKQRKQKFQKQLINYYKENSMEFIINNWEYALIAIMAIDKAVALSPSEWDDLIWTSIKKSIYKIAGK